MKNLYVLPSPNPSRLYYFGDSPELRLTKYPNLFRAFERSTQHIYITNNGKFNRGDYVTDGIEVMKATPKLVDAQGLIDRREWKRIILTTDTALINEGVQSISEEFLKWYIENQNCEKVETTEKSRCCGRCNGVDDLCFTDMTCTLHESRGCETCYGKKVEYSITLPKKETEQVLLQSSIDGEAIWGEKQETIEEAFGRFMEINFSGQLTRGFVLGAMKFANKLAQETLYSREDMIKAIKFGELYQTEGSKSLFEKRGKTPSQAIIDFLDSFKKK